MKEENKLNENLYNVILKQLHIGKYNKIFINDVTLYRLMKWKHFKIEYDYSGTYISDTDDGLKDDLMVEFDFKVNSDVVIFSTGGHLVYYDNEKNLTINYTI